MIRSYLFAWGVMLALMIAEALWQWWAAFRKRRRAAKVEAALAAERRAA